MDDLVHPSLQVWGYAHKGMTLTERLDAINRLNIVNRELERCFRGEIDFFDWLDIAEYHGVDVDDFAESLHFGLISFYGIDSDDVSDTNFYLSG
jgi:hypothetical protein